MKTKRNLVTKHLNSCLQKNLHACCNKYEKDAGIRFVKEIRLSFLYGSVYKCMFIYSYVVFGPFTKICLSLCLYISPATMNYSYTTRDCMYRVSSIMDRRSNQGCPLIHSFLVHPFSTRWKHKKALRFTDVFRGRKRVHWERMALPRFTLRSKCVMPSEKDLLQITAPQNVLPFKCQPHKMV